MRVTKPQQVSWPEADIAGFAARKLVLRDGIIVNDIRQQPEAAHPAHALSGGTHDPGH